MSKSKTLSSESLDVQEYEQLFLQFEEQIRAISKHIKQIHESIASVNVLFARIKEEIDKETGTFDTEDLEWVQSKIEELNKNVEQAESEKANKEQEYQRKKNMYDSSIVKMKHILLRRKQILEEVDNVSQVFLVCPDLLKKFAKKRATLSQMVEESERELKNKV